MRFQGACEEVLKGNIKVLPGYIDHFTEDKVVFSDNREENFDIVVFATGFVNVKDNIRRILGDKLADEIPQIWGVDPEGELYGAWKDNGCQRLWLQVGTLMQARYFSKCVYLAPCLVFWYLSTDSPRFFLAGSSHFASRPTSRVSPPLPTTALGLENKLVLAGFSRPPPPPCRPCVTSFAKRSPSLRSFPRLRCTHDDSTPRLR